MRYYIAENGQPAGPFEPNELLAHGLTVNSLGWCEGMPNWNSASQVPELMAILSGGIPTTPNIPNTPTTPTTNGDVQLPQMPPMGGGMPLPQVPPVVNPQPTSTTPYGQGGSTTTNNPLPFPQNGPTNSPQIAPKTWLLESVIATVLCSLCCGVPLVGLIPGAIAIYMAWSSKMCYTKGDVDGANKKASSARKWFFITIAVGLAFALYGGFTNLQNSNITDIINDMQNGNTPFFYGIPK